MSAITFSFFASGLNSIWPPGARGSGLSVLTGDVARHERHATSDRLGRGGQWAASSLLRSRFARRLSRSLQIRQYITPFRASPSSPPSRMQTPLRGTYHQQSRRAKSLNQMFSADASKVQVSVAGQSSSIDYRLAQTSTISSSESSSCGSANNMNDVTSIEDCSDQWASQPMLSAPVAAASA